MHQHKSGSEQGSSCEPQTERQRGELISDALRAQVREIAIASLSPRQRTTSNLYLDPRRVVKGTRLGPAFQSWLVESDCILCFADHEPRADFAHACSYFLHDPENGRQLRRVPAQFPPHPAEGIHLLDTLYEGVRPVEVFPIRAKRKPKAATRMDRALMESAPAGKRRAILFAGEVEARHLNDLELYLRRLQDTFGFARTDIVVLFQDGTRNSGVFFNKQHQRRPWPGAQPGEDPTFTLTPDGRGSRTAFLDALRRLELGPDDLLFVHTEGHGGYQYGDDGGQFICAIPDGAGSTDRYFSSQMREDLALAGCKSLLMLMNQCFSGGFKDDVLAGSKAQLTFFASACGADGLAYATPDLKWNMFSRNWLQAEMQPQTTDTDHDGKVEAMETYKYCDDFNNAITGPDSLVCERAPPADASGHSPADDISLTA